MANQIVVLLALSAGLFDAVPLEKVKDAEAALMQACTKMDKETAGRLTSADKLSDDDRKTLLNLAAGALHPFQPAPAPDNAAQVSPLKAPPAKPAP